MEPKRVLIVEDEPLTCHALKLALDDISQKDPGPEFEVAIYHTYGEAQDLISSNNMVNLALLDFRLGPDTSATGFDLAKLLRASATNAKIIFLTSISDRHQYYTIFREINPEGFIIKSELDFKGIEGALTRVISGETYFSPSIQDFLRKEMSIPKEVEDVDRQLLFLLSKGAGTRDLSEELKMSPSGIEWRKRRLARLFGLESGQTLPLIESAKTKGLL
ncbi:response regulator [Flagellimonas abyssi]|uniref:Response regulator n=1 Tax=Flagellimonas abyssi TaxID=2864871 RepID=A0ABS7EUF9_9FLAO|nr:response regulator [Allomuricauda abyssi]MBW8201227.1 response regulator [Allomuricauda abyssi]